MKKILLFGLFLFCQVCALPQINSAELKSKLDKIVHNEFFKKSSIAVDIYDLKEEKSLYEWNKKLLLHPASNMKLLTTATALYFLGPDYDFETKVFYTGSIENSVLNGDLYVQGGCDPDFTSKDLSALVTKIKELGINKITGSIYGDVSAMDALYWGSGWMWDDDPSTDLPYMTPLNINSNTIVVKVSPLTDGNTKVTLSPQSSFFNVINKSATYGKDSTKLSITRDWMNKTNDILIDGFISPKSKGVTEEFNVCKSPFYFLTLLKEELAKQNISIGDSLALKDVPADATLAASEKRKFGEVIVNLNKTSDNLSAEMTLRAIALKTFGKPATADKGILMVDSLIALSGLHPSDYNLVDGSGLSQYNDVSAEMLAGVLKFIYKNKPELYKVLYNSFPIAGVDGSLSSRMKNTAAANNVHAKTGTLSGISALSGYVTTKNNHPLVFSIIIQNYVGGKRNASRFEDEICKLLAEAE
jgi:serine-type D-Ala-D-Ala carboxypeptidase/endopeptidase (penicillin-binding protein 4)